MKKINVLVVPSDRTGVGAFRSINPHLALEANYPEEFIVHIDYEPQLNNENWLKQFDIIHFHRTLGDYEQFQHLIDKLEKMGIITIMDLDDYWAPGQHHPAYLLIKNANLDEKIKNNLKFSKHITTTTKFFADEIKKFNKNVYILPNAIDPTEKQYTPNPEPSEKLRIGWLGGSCLSDDTEILTNEGWKLFENLSGYETVATLNPKTNVIEYHKPTNYIKKEHNGDLYVCNTDEINFAVTGNHNMYVSLENSDFSLKTMDEVYGNNLKFKKNGIWNVKDVKYFNLPGILPTPFDSTDYSEKSILMDDWLKFFGFWLSNGWLSNKNEVCLLKSKNKTDFFKVKEILEKYDFLNIIHENDETIIFSNKQLHSYLNDISKEFNVPREILNFVSSRQLSIFMEWFLKTYDDKNVIECYSKQFSDDIMEIALKTNKSAFVINNNNDYVVIFYNPETQLQPIVKKEEIKKEKYFSNVYCVEVTNHIIYVRRNGKACWVGNSHLHDLKLLDDLVGKLKTNNLLDKVQFVLCGFDLRGTHTEIDPVTKQQKVRNIHPKESVWYQYERIFTDDYRSISPEYKEFLLKFVQEEYPNVSNESYRRVWTKHISSYATNYNLFDVSLAPLEENIFNYVKSQLKAIEAGFHNKALIAQNYGPYKIDLVNAIKFGGEIDPLGNAILIDSNKNHKDWFEAIKKLINNPKLVEQLRNNLSNTIKNNYSINKVTEQRRELYLNLLKKYKPEFF
jgi:glycosyltransferase involved in cell wall biosynthesis